MRLFDPLHQKLHEVLDLRQLDHSMTASNLANAETPGFKAKHLAFEDTLARVFEADGGTMQTTNARHLDGSGIDEGDPDVVELPAPAWALDGNSVVAESENVRMSENALMYQGVSTAMDKRLALLRYAASDGKR